MATKRLWGTGTVYRPTYIDKKTGKPKKSSFWWIKFWHNGKQQPPENSHSRVKSDAYALLKQRLGEAGIGKLLPSHVAKTTFEDLKKLIEDDYEANHRDSKYLNVVLARLTARFAGMKAVEITPVAIETYKTDQRKAENERKKGYANATVNRDLAALKHAFRLGLRRGVVAAVPHITLLQEDNIRKGFFELKDFQALLAHVPERFKPLYRVAYITGWRLDSELLTRCWQHVDFINRRLRLDPGETKNGKGREFIFTPESELEGILTDQREVADEIRQSKGVEVSHLFFLGDGSPITESRCRNVWSAAAQASGIQRYVHDFRRTAVRNLELAGVARSAAMDMVGHKTESIYHRYAITDERMRQDAAGKLDAFLKGQAAALEREAERAKKPNESTMSAPESSTAPNPESA